MERELAIRDAARSVERALGALAPADAPWTERAAALDALERALAVSRLAPAHLGTARPGTADRDPASPEPTAAGTADPSATGPGGAEADAAGPGGAEAPAAAPVGAEPTRSRTDESAPDPSGPRPDLAPPVEALPPVPPDAVVHALSDRRPNLRAAALGALAREPAWARAVLAAEDLARALASPLEEERLRALHAALAAVHAGADPVPLARAAADTLDDRTLDDDVRRAALGLTVHALGDPERRDAFAAHLRARWEEDETARDAAAACEWLELGPEPFLALAGRLAGEPGAVFAALAAGRGAPLDVERVLVDWPAALSDAARFESLRLTALLAATPERVDRWVARAAELGDDHALKAVVRAVGPDPLLDALPSASPDAARALLDGLTGPDVSWTPARARRACVRLDLADATLDALSPAALLDDRAVVAALAEWLERLGPRAAERVARLLGPEQVSRHAEHVAAAWERLGRPRDWLALFDDDGAAPALRDGLLAVARELERADEPPEPGELRALVRALARFEDDPVVADWLGARLSEALRRWRASGAARDANELGSLASPAARAGGPALVPTLEIALAEARAEPGLARALVAACALTPEGLRVLEVELDADGWDPTAEQVARIELLEAGRLSGGRRAPLLAGLETLPTDLAERALAALVAHSDPASVDALFELARRADDETLRVRAVDALGRIGGDAVVARLARDYRGESDYALRRARGAALADAGAVEVLEGLLRTLLAGRFAGGRPDPATWPADFRPPSVEAARRRLADELQVELARLGRPWIDPAWGVLWTLSVRAADTFERRLERRPVEGSGLALFAELPTLSALRGDPRLPEALARSGPWWRGDGRWLAACARALEAPSATGRALAAAADVSLAGERILERGRRGRAQALLLDLALEAEDWPAVARAVGRTLSELESGALARSELYRAWGAPWPAGGSHPANQLRALRAVAEARLRLAAGDTVGARAAAARARAVPAAAEFVEGHLEGVADALGR